MSYSTLKSLVFILLAVFTFQTINAQIIQWRGPDRDGKFPDKNLLKEWPENGPKIKFIAKDLGKTYSSTVATEDKIFVTGVKDSLEYISALDLSGNIIWQKSYGKGWDQSFPDARCTPTIQDDRVYVLSGLDNLVCFNINSGEVIWEVDIHKTYNSVWDMFGVSESILIVDDKVIVTPCGKSTTVIALNKFTGDLIWKSESLNAKRSNMSPILVNHNNKNIIVAGTQTHLVGVDPNDGKIIWKYLYNVLSPNGDNSTIIANSPIYKDSCIWVSNGWDAKSVMLKLSDDGSSVSEKYVDQTFDNQNHGVVLVEGYLYGSNFTGRQSGKWICMNWNTGEIVWIGDFNNKGPIIYADGMLYLYDEKRGNIALVVASPKEFKIISSFRVKEGRGPHWSRPAIYNGILYVRHGESLIAYDIKSK